MATQTTKLITISDYSDWWQNSAYLEEAKLNPNILKAQIADLKPILDNSKLVGFSLYEDLQDYIEASKTPTDSDLDTLLESITPFLVYASLKYYLQLANVYPTNMGFRKLLETNSEAISDEAMSAIMDSTIATAKKFEYDLRQFLCENHETYTWDVSKASKFSSTVKIGKVGFKKVDHT